MVPNKVVLLACGSYNPPTNMHLRMFEIARDHLHRMGSHLVVGGLISPVHDAYAKNDLESATHRKEMVKLALESSDWIRLSDWECNQESWSRTRQVLNYHQNHVNELIQTSIVNDNNSNMNEESNWFRNNRNGCNNNSVGIKLLCGADLLESFGTPGLWADEDIESIVGRYGLVVVTRSKSNPLEFIYNSDVLTKYMSNIVIVTEWIGNEVSSTKVRRAMRRNESVKYLIPDSVINYIKMNGLYGCKQNKYDLSPQTTSKDIISSSPSSLISNCVNICNNNLILDKLNYNNNNQLLIDDVDVVVKKNTTAFTILSQKHHPGQAVKIKTEEEDIKTIKNNKKKVGNGKVPLKSSKSSNDFYTLKNDFESDESLKEDCKSCDENLIKFIFSKHGIEIISDVETIV